MEVSFQPTAHANRILDIGFMVNDELLWQNMYDAIARGSTSLCMFSISRFTSSLLISLSMSFLVRISRCCRLRICCLQFHILRGSPHQFLFQLLSPPGEWLPLFCQCWLPPTHHAKAVSLAHAQHFDLAVFIHPANDRTDLNWYRYRVRSRSCCVYSPFPCLFLVHMIWSWYVRSILLYRSQSV